MPDLEQHPGPDVLVGGGAEHALGVDEKGLQAGLVAAPHTFTQFKIIVPSSNIYLLSKGNTLKMPSLIIIQLLLINSHDG